MAGHRRWTDRQSSKQDIAEPAARRFAKAAWLPRARWSALTHRVAHERAAPANAKPLAEASLLRDRRCDVCRCSRICVLLHLVRQSPATLFRGDLFSSRSPALFCDVARRPDGELCHFREHLDAPLSHGHRSTRDRSQVVLVNRRRASARRSWPGGRRLHQLEGLASLRLLRLAWVWCDRG